MWLHPDRYHTVMCTRGAACKRTVVGHAHVPQRPAPQWAAAGGGPCLQQPPPLVVHRSGQGLLPPQAAPLRMAGWVAQAAIHRARPRPAHSTSTAGRSPGTSARALPQVCFFAHSSQELRAPPASLQQAHPLGGQASPQTSPRAPRLALSLTMAAPAGEGAFAAASSAGAPSSSASFHGDSNCGCAFTIATAAGNGCGNVVPAATNPAAASDGFGYALPATAAPAAAGNGFGYTLPSTDAAACDGFGYAPRSAGSAGGDFSVAPSALLAAPGAPPLGAGAPRTPLQLAPASWDGLLLLPTGTLGGRGSGGGGGTAAQLQARMQEAEVGMCTASMAAHAAALEAAAAAVAPRAADCATAFAHGVLNGGRPLLRGVAAAANASALSAAWGLTVSLPEPAIQVRAHAARAATVAGCCAWGAAMPVPPPPAPLPAGTLLVPLSAWHVAARRGGAPGGRAPLQGEVLGLGSPFQGPFPGW
jgi:hypothetical protein